MFESVAETIADGKKIRVAGTGSMRSTGIDEKVHSDGGHPLNW